MGSSAIYAVIVVDILLRSHKWLGEKLTRRMFLARNAAGDLGSLVAPQLGGSAIYAWGSAEDLLWRDKMRDLRTGDRRQWIQQAREQQAIVQQLERVLSDG